MTHGLQIALSIVAGLGVGSAVTGILDRRHTSQEMARARDHTSAEARVSTPLPDLLRRLAKAISVHLERVRAWVAFTEPLMTPSPAPPELNVDDALYELTGTFMVTASDSARERLQASVDSVRAFEYAVSEWQAEPVTGWSEDPEGRSPRMKLEDARARRTRQSKRRKTRCETS